MKKLFLLMLWAAMAVGAQAQYAKLHEVKASSIAPEGWIKEYLVRQQNGMTGNVTMQGFPYTSNMWHGVIPNNNSWWPYEQTGYYLDGSYKLGVLLNDPSLSKHFKDNLEWVISHPDKDGMLGATFSTQASLWPYAVFFKAFIAYYMETGDKEALEVFHKFYTDAVSTETLGIGERNHTNIEAVLKIYEWTHDKAMLDKAVKAYDLADKHRVSSDLGFSMMKTDNKLVNHGVTFCESVKIPVMLYMYTGNREYLDVAEHSIEMIERDQIGPSGVPSCNECMMTKDPMQSHETCVTSDLTWSLGYFLMATGKVKYADMIEKAIFNAAPGAISKHFENLQYFSTDNQVISTSESNHGKEGRWYFAADMTQFSPKTSPACCAGNVHRAMPNYAARMWMEGENDGVTAALYGPSEYHGELSTITEETNYPFSDKIAFTFSNTKGKAFPFSLRIPGWCRNATLTINGKPYDKPLTIGTFISLDRAWADGDKVELTLPMELRLNRNRNLLSVERGPLLYSYAVPEKVEIDKKTENAFFPTLNLYPAGDWNYALDVNEDNFTDKIKVLNPEGEGYAFDNQGGVPRLQVPVRKIKDWTLANDGKYTPMTPVAYEVEDDVEWITLVPYGATRLRMTQFPEAISYTSLPVSDFAVAGEKYPYNRDADILAQKYLPEAKPAKAEWTAVTPDETGLIDFDKIYGESESLTYLKATVTADRAGEAYLAVNSKDAAAVWLNGKLVHTVKGPNDVAHHMPDLVKVKLRKGANNVMMKVGRYGSSNQYADGWGAKLQCVRKADK